MAVDKKKQRRAINISLQSKKYAEPINEMIQNWEDENLNISTQVCDALLLIERLNNFTSLSNIFKIVNMLGGLSSIYGYTDENIDEMLNEIITIDHDKFSKILIELNDVKFDETVIEKMKEKRLKLQPQKKEKTYDKKNENMDGKTVEEKSFIQKEKMNEEKNVVKDNNENNLEKIEKEKTNEEIVEEAYTIEEFENDDGKDIPIDFLFNS